MRQLRQHSALITVVGFFLVQGVALAWTTRGIYGVDFAAYYLASRALQQGRDIYTLTDADWNTLAAEANVPDVAPPYRYPPLIVGVLRPITSLPFTAALLIWRALTVLALFMAAMCLSQFLRQRWIDPLVFAAAAFFVPAITTLYAGQANIFVLAALTLYLLLDQRHRPWLAGMALAISILIKPLAIALAAYLAWRRDWRRLAALGASIMIGVIVMLILSGLATNIDYVRSFADVTPSHATPYPPNQSVFGFWLRLLAANEFAPALVDLPTLATVFSWVTAGTLGVVTAYLTWPRRRDTFALESGLVLVTFSLIIPISWYHQLTIDLIPLLLAWFATTRRSLRAALVLAYGLIGVQGLAWKLFVGHTLLLSLATYGLLIIYGVIALVLWSRHPITEESLGRSEAIEERITHTTNSRGEKDVER